MNPDRLLQALILIIIAIGTGLWIYVLTRIFSSTLVYVAAGVATALVYRAATESKPR